VLVKKNDQNMDVAVKIGSYSFHSNHQLLRNEGEEKKLSFRESVITIKGVGYRFVVD
jgi:hypothetical protein